MIITNVGLAMDALETKDGIVKGEGTVYSKDEDGLQLEYEDDFTFTYDISKGLVKTNLDKKIFGEHLETIAEMLIDNLQTNYL